MNASHDPQSDPIQPLTRPEDAPLIRSVEDLRQRWRSIFGTGGFIRSLWLMSLTADGRQLPLILPIDDLPTRIPPSMIARISDLLSLMLTDDAAVAMALTCPLAPGHHHGHARCSPVGDQGFNRDDRLRADDIQVSLELAQACGEWPWRTWPLHIAREGVVETVPARGVAAA